MVLNDKSSSRSSFPTWRLAAWERRISIGIALVAIAAACVAAAPQVAQAGTNGQQIRFDLDHCGYGLGNVSVYGYNQNGQWSHWAGGSSNDAIFIAGWWWVGNITVYYTQGGQWRQAQAYVPQGNDTSYQYWANVVRVDCHGSWKLGSGRLVAGSGYIAACVDLTSNILGSYTKYWNFQGYYGKGWNQATLWYGIAYGGTAPGLVTISYYSIECN
jgi:hypothetical protein